MCDYSLEGYASRKAQVGDQLVVSKWARAFMQVETVNQVATKADTRQGLTSGDLCLTCLQPGTKLEVMMNGQSFRDALFNQYGSRSNGSRDYVELPGYGPMVISSLPVGTTAKVLSIPGVNITERGVENVKAALVEHDRTQPTADVPTMTPAK